MTFLFVMTLWALIQQVINWSGLTTGKADLLLFLLGSIILCFSVWIIIEALLLLKRNTNHESITS